jgi:hypothetical protein
VRRSTALAAAAVLSLALASSGASERQGGRTFVLTALADQGTVYWRPCSAEGWSLGFRHWGPTTTEVTFRAGGMRLHRALQSDGPTVWFPFRRDRVQQLTVESGGEAETIYAHVRVEFDEPHSLANCWIYAPPRLRVTLYGRDHVA